MTRRGSGVQIPHGPPVFYVFVFPGSHSGSQTKFSKFNASAAFPFYTCSADDVCAGQRLLKRTPKPLEDPSQ